MEDVAQQCLQWEKVERGVEFRVEWGVTSKIKSSLCLEPNTTAFSKQNQVSLFLNQSNVDPVHADLQP